MCGGSPMFCVLVERKAWHRGKWEQQQHRTSLAQLLVQHKRTVMAKMNGYYLYLLFSSLQRPSSLWRPPDWESRRRWAYSLGVGEFWWMGGEVCQFQMFSLIHPIFKQASVVEFLNCNLWFPFTLPSPTQHLKTQVPFSFLSELLCTHSHYLEN